MNKVLCCLNSPGFDIPRVNEARNTVFSLTDNCYDGPRSDSRMTVAKFYLFQNGIILFHSKGKSQVGLVLVKQRHQ